MKKIRYEIDPYNRLVIEDKTGKKSDLPKFRKVIDGKFKLDKNNDLSYHIKVPLDNRETLPHQLKLKGKWSLTDNHDLRITLDKQGRETFGDEITLQGEILDVNDRSLLFAVTTRTKENIQSTYILNLGGKWRADKNNRLSFHVRREKGRHDILTFNGAWEINKKHQLVYEYEKALLIRKKRKAHTLTFKGYWDIKDKTRLSYVLSGSTDSTFSFRTATGIFKENYIRYEIGIELSNKKNPARKILTLSGRWRLKKDVGLIFEVEYENRKMHAIIFGADAKLTDKDTVTFKLRNELDNKDLGVEIELSRKILKGDGEAFLRLLKSKRESAVYAGVTRRW